MPPSPAPAFEAVPFSGVSSVSIREFRMRSFNRPWHEHPEIELTWIIQGSGLRYVGDSVEPFAAGDFCLIGARVPHAWISHPAAPGPVHSMVLQLDPERLGADFLRLPEFTRIGRLLERAARGLHFTQANPSRLFRAIRSAASPWQRLSAALQACESLASERGVRELSLSAWPASRLGPRANDRLGRVMALIAADGTKDLRQNDAARAAGLTPAAFSRFFRRATGRTFKCTMNRIRLGSASRLLLETDLTIGEIAFAAGFGSLSNFNRAFHAARGMAPGDFRRQSVSATCGTASPCTTHAISPRLQPRPTGGIPKPRLHPA
jgi:AraC-like DNA-binding protein